MKYILWLMVIGGAFNAIRHHYTPAYSIEREDAEIFIICIGLVGLVIRDVIIILREWRKPRN